MSSKPQSLQDIKRLLAESGYEFSGNHVWGLVRRMGYEPILFMGCNCLPDEETARAFVRDYLAYRASPNFGKPGKLSHITLGNSGKRKPVNKQRQALRLAVARVKVKRKLEEAGL